MGRDSKRTLLIIDDDRMFCDVVSQYFENTDLEVVAAHTCAQGRDVYLKRNVDVVLLDQRLPDGQGKDLCLPILAQNDQTKIIFTTAHPSFENAVEAVKVGAHDYLAKPFELAELGLAVSKALRTLDLERVEQVQSYRNRKESEETVLVGSETSLLEIDRLIDYAAASQAAVLVTGETGTGKSLVAKAVHYRTRLKNGPFISINCAALPENLIEAELFGHEKGAFSGAVSSKKGIFEMAEGGTLALEEIGELPVHLQSKLLGVLDNKMIKRIGGESLRPVRVRIITTTNLNLEKAVKEKSFREDLYYRLGVLRIHLPPLRRRLRDIPLLCQSFIKEMSPTSGVEISAEQTLRLMEYDWPGNIRELKNVMERSIILRRDRQLRPAELLRAHYDRESDRPEKSPPGFTTREDSGEEELKTLEKMEKEYIEYTLNKLDQNHTRTARALGIARSTLMRKIKRFGLP